MNPTVPLADPQRFPVRRPESVRDPPGPRTLPLHILHLEDNEADRELVRRALAGEEFACEFSYAANQAEFAAALAAEKFDLILSDFTMPGYDGGAALALAQEQCPEVPYLFVSGTIGEEQAIASLRSGATDYVLKARLELLRPAVRRALREAGERVRRRAAEAALRQAEARFRDIFENAVEGISQSTPQGRFLAANRAMARLCGYASPEELCTQVRDLARDLYVEPAVRAEFVRLLEARGEVLAYESQIKRQDGTVIWISENARVVRGPRDEPVHYESMVTDITARRAAEAALHRSEERFREMAERIDDVFYIVALDTGRWSYASPAYEQIWGRPLAELYAEPEQGTGAIVPEDHAMVLAARRQLAGGREYHIEYRIRRPDGTQRWIEDRSYLIGGPAGEMKRAVGIAMDITRRRQLEAQLLQAQKMEAVGQLAGGLAHDFNNVLTVVIGYARVLLDRGTMPPDAIGPLTQIFTAGNRAANLTRQLLVFSCKQAVDRRALDLNQVAGEISEMLRRLIGEHIKLELALSRDPCPVEADAGMMEQVIMNLAVNARDAMPNGGTLTIATECLVLDGPAAARHPGARPGAFVCLSVRDTGCGIPPENHPRIFEPFFTTKEVGHGTGLGLAMVFGIMQQHQGWIELESKVGAGTCFRILLPAGPPAAEVPADQLAGTAAASRGAETMLLVEDEPAVREFAAAVLRSHGYRVLQACSGVDALEVWKWHGPRIALLLTDLVMPDGLGGVELAARLRREKPTLKVVLTSGYANETIGQEFHPPAGTHFIHKPYQPQMLVQAVRDALDDNFNR
jgi:two-component system cell cycle sensor histidine kinase/response regulator CckA